MLLTGKQRSRGIELTAAGRLTGNWYLRGGIGMQNASIVEDKNGLAGNRVSNVAQRNGSVFLTYKPAEGLYLSLIHISWTTSAPAIRRCRNWPASRWTRSSWTPA